MNEENIASGGPNNNSGIGYQAPQLILPNKGDIELGKPLQNQMLINNMNEMQFDWSSDNEEQEEHNKLLAETREKILLADEENKSTRHTGQENNGISKSPQKQSIDITSVNTSTGQPRFHERNKGFMESCCSCMTERCDLLRKETRYYLKFRENMVQSYDESNPEHEQTLKEFYVQVFGKQASDQKMYSEEWQSIGFQSRNPRTDFRGGGVLGLQCLRYFQQTRTKEFEEMRVDTSQTFFLAISSINVTHMLIIYFYMNKSEVAEDQKRLRAGRKQTKRFARLNAEAKRAFFEIHSFLFIYLYRLWKQEYEKVKPQMPNFGVIMSLVKLELHDFLKSPLINSLNALKSHANGRIETKFSQQ